MAEQMAVNSSHLVVLARPERLKAWRLFVAIGALAVLLGGVIAAAVAHNPNEFIVWLVAYLVLVIGVAQAAIGLGQAALAEQAPGTLRVGSELLLFNLGNLAVIYGTFITSFATVLLGTVLIWGALALFYQGTNQAASSRCKTTYRVIIYIVGIGALIGLILSLVRNLF